MAPTGPGSHVPVQGFPSRWVEKPDLGIHRVEHHRPGGREE